MRAADLQALKNFKKRKTENVGSYLNFLRFDWSEVRFLF